jgi:hypothetical protein
VSTKRSGLPLEIATVSRANLLSSLESVRGCLKTTSMLWMHALGLPVLSGVVVSDWSKASANAVRRFSRQCRFSRFLLRIDKRDQRWTRRRGGYLLTLADVPAMIKELRREGMIAALLEPASPYADQYSLAGVTAPDQEKLIIEVVGPGFDASDLLRGDLQAHERWEATLGPIMPRVRSSDPLSCHRINLAPQDQYAGSVQRRLAKIGARLKNPAFPDAVLQGSAADSARLVAEAIAFLKATRQATLLKHAETYAPIPEKHVTSFARDVRTLLAGLSSYGINLGPTSFAASVIPRRGLVFWDFFPARKQEAASLYPGKTPRDAGYKRPLATSCLSA